MQDPILSQEKDVVDLLGINKILTWKVDFYLIFHSWKKLGIDAENGENVQMEDSIIVGNNCNLCEK